MYQKRKLETDTRAPLGDDLSFRRAGTRQSPSVVFSINSPERTLEKTVLSSS